MTVPPIGFVILSHRDPAQLLRLVRALNRLYGDPPIACHHDMGQAPLDRTAFPANVSFVEDWVATGWGKWSVVEAFLRALATLYARVDAPDWFVLLSGADYPIAPPNRVLANLRDSGCDAFIDLHQIGTEPARATLVGDINPLLHHLDTDESRHTKWRFYLARQFWIPILRRRPHWRLGRYTVRLPFTDRRFFGKRMALWWGEHWFSGNRRVADLLLHPTADHLALRQELKWKTFPEETYYHTLLCSTPELMVCRDNKRYTEWNGGGAHPMTLTTKEVPLLLASAAHFARKFDADSAALDEIDAALAEGATEADATR